MAAVQDRDLDNIIDELTTYYPEENLSGLLESHLDEVHGHTAKRDRIAVEDLIDWMKANKVTNVNDETVEEHLKYLVRTRYAKNTIKQRYYGITNFTDSQLSETSNSLVREVSWTEVAKDEMKKQDIEEEGRLGKGARPITEEEKEKMRETAPTHRTELMTEMLWQCGLRAEELAKSEVERIDLDERILEVDTVKRDDHTREIGFDLELKFMLERYLSSYRPKFGRSSPYLFVTQKSDHTLPHNLTRTIKDLADDADIQDYSTMQNGAKKAEITPHSFRKSLGIRLDDKNHGLKEIAERLGHSDAQTVSTYLDIQ
ncbi:tyrosine-type recombinase/integrase [Halosimplex halobium]|uniref:tyrosine-type recombinase/integrase n=1 Tax=Halosimplex halobium TaxID=3396618 RepID=UPI003F5508A8